MTDAPAGGGGDADPVGDDPAGDHRAGDDRAGQPAAGPTIEVANEFASVVVFKVATGNGHRVRVVAPQQGRSIDLDPLTLEALTFQTPERLSQLLAEAYRRQEGDG